MITYILRGSLDCLDCLDSLGSPGFLDCLGSLDLNHQTRISHVYKTTRVVEYSCSGSVLTYLVWLSRRVYQ